MARLRSWPKFYLRRFFRIAPAYYLSLGGSVLLAGPFLASYGVSADRIPALQHSVYNGKAIQYLAENIVLHISFLFGLSPAWVFGTQLPDWSLSLEMLFYAMFPLLSLLLVRFGIFVTSAVAIAVCLLTDIHWLALFQEPSPLFFKLPVFLSGMLVCYSTLAANARAKTAFTFFALAYRSPSFKCMVTRLYGCPWPRDSSPC